MLNKGEGLLVHVQWSNHCTPGYFWRDFGGLFKEEFAELEASRASCSLARRKFNSVSRFFSEPNYLY